MNNGTELEPKKINSRIVDMTGWVMAEHGVSGSRITVIRFERTHKTKGAYWLCKCSCNKEKIILGSQLRSGAVLSCGCLSSEKARERMTALHDLQRKGAEIFYRPLKNMTGWRMWEHGVPKSKLHVIKAEEDVKTPKGQRQKMWQCVCTECGKICSFTGGHLRRGDVLTCGCGRRKPREKANENEESLHPGNDKKVDGNLQQS